MDNEQLAAWEQKVRDTPTANRMAIIYDFADELDGDQARIAGSLLRMTNMRDDLETKSIERKRKGDGLIAATSWGWMIILLFVAASGCLMVFNNSLGDIEINIAENTIRTSSIGIGAIFISIVGGSAVLLKAISRINE